MLQASINAFRLFHMHAGRKVCMLRGEVDELSGFGQDWIKFLLLFKPRFLSFAFDVCLEQNYFRLHFLTLKERKLVMSSCSVVVFMCPATRMDCASVG